MWALDHSPQSLRDLSLPRDRGVQRLATGGCDNMVRVWRFSGQEQRWHRETELRREGQTTHDDWVRDVAWAPSVGLPGAMIATCGQVRVCGVELAGRARTRPGDIVLLRYAKGIIGRETVGGRWYLSKTSGALVLIAAVPVLGRFVGRLVRSPIAPTSVRLSVVVGHNTDYVHLREAPSCLLTGSPPFRIPSHALFFSRT